MHEVCPPTDAVLLQRLRMGDASAFEDLVRAHAGRLLVVVHRFLGQDADAHDALQDAFLSAFKALDRFDGKSSLATWLHRIAVNAALMKLRTRRRRREAPIEELLPRFIGDGHEAAPTVGWRFGLDGELQRDETRALVRRCIDRLPEAHRTILLLRDIEELDTEETARLLGVSVGVVKTRLHRARQALRGLLDPYLRRDAL